MDPVTVDIAGACKALGVGRSSIYKLLGLGRLTGVRICGRTLVTTESIYRLVEVSIVEAGASASAVREQVAS